MTRHAYPPTLLFPPCSSQPHRRWRSVVVSIQYAPGSVKRCAMRLSRAWATPWTKVAAPKARPLMLALAKARQRRRAEGVYLCMTKAFFKGLWALVGDVFQGPTFREKE